MAMTEMQGYLADGMHEVGMSIYDIANILRVLEEEEQQARLLWWMAQHETPPTKSEVILEVTNILRNP